VSTLLLKDANLYPILLLMLLDGLILKLIQLRLRELIFTKWDSIPLPEEPRFLQAKEDNQSMLGTEKITELLKLMPMFLWLITVLLKN